MKRTQYAIILIVCACATLFAQVGKTISPVVLIDANNDSAGIPYIGKKVFALFYIDPDVKDVNDPLGEAIDNKNFPKNFFGAIGIVNCKDSWIPKNLVRSIAKAKQQRFPKAMLLFDNNGTLSSSWSLGDCNNNVVVLVIGKDSKIKYLKKNASKAESISVIDTVIASITTELNKQN